MHNLHGSNEILVRDIANLIIVSQLCLIFQKKKQITAWQYVMTSKNVKLCTHNDNTCVLNAVDMNFNGVKQMQL